MIENRRFFTAAFAGLALAFSGISLAHAQAGQDASAAPACVYTLDVNHTAVLARVPHNGFSYEIFRFTPASGELNWNPTTPASSSVNVTVNVASIQTPVEGFSAELSAPQFLNAGEFPTATFVSTAFRQSDAAHGEVDGNFTLKGVTKPVTFQVELVGAGAARGGASVIGFHATGLINNTDYSLPAFIRGQTQIVIDAEFARR